MISLALGAWYSRPEEGHQGQERRALRDADPEGQGREKADGCNEGCRSGE